MTYLLETGGKIFKLNVTDPDLLIPIKQTRVTTRHSDLREPQPSSSDSHPASSQPETTTSESSVSFAQFPVWKLKCREHQYQSH